MFCQILFFHSFFFSIQLAWQDSFRTFDWQKALPSLETAIKQMRELVAIV